MTKTILELVVCILLVLASSMCTLRAPCRVPRQAAGRSALVSEIMVAGGRGAIARMCDVCVWVLCVRALFLCVMSGTNFDPLTMHTLVEQNMF